MLAFTLPSRDKNQLLLILRCKFTKSAEKSLTLQAKFALLLQKSGEHQLLSGQTERGYQESQCSD